MVRLLTVGFCHFYVMQPETERWSISYSLGTFLSLTCLQKQQRQDRKWL